MRDVCLCKHEVVATTPSLSRKLRHRSFHRLSSPPRRKVKTTMATIADSLTQVLSRVAAAANGRSVRLVAVSKRHPAALIREAHAAGQRVFGESYVKELQDKGAELEALEGIEFEFIGRLQSECCFRARARLWGAETDVFSCSGPTAWAIAAFRQQGECAGGLLAAPEEGRGFV